MKFSGYWPVLLIVSLFYIKCIETTDEFETESSDSNFVLPRAKYHYKTTPEPLDQKSMVGWYKMVNGFISAVHSKSAETVDIILTYFSGQKTFVVPQSIYELLKLHYALIACVVVGLLYIVIMSITGLIVFCCRCCCNNCGGKRVQDQTRTTSLWRKILILFLLILIVLLLIAVICMFVTHNSLSTNYSTSEKKIDIIFEDMQSMLYTTKTQISYIAVNCTKETLEAVFSELNGIGEFLETEITEKMEPLRNLISTADLVASGIPNFTNTLYTINDAGDRIFDYSEIIKRDLEDIKSNLEKLKNSTECDCKDVLNPDQFDIKNLNFQNEFIKSAADSFRKLDSKEFESSLQNVTEIIKILPKEVNDQTISLQNEIKSRLNKASNEIHNSVDKLMSDIFPQIEKALYNASKYTKQYMQSGKKYDSYGKYTTLGICIIMTVIVSFLVIGLFFGICGYQNSRPPTKRTTMSNVGGHFLLISVTWMFIFSGILMLFTIILFSFGSITEAYVCRPLYDEKLIMANKILENIMNITNTSTKIPYIGEIAPGDIRKCNSNETVFTILDLENRLNLSEKLDFEKKLNAEELIKKLKDNITFPEIKIMNDETETFMKNVMKVLKLEDINKGIGNYNENITINIDEQLTILKNLSDTKEELKDEIDAILNDTMLIQWKLIEFNKKKEELLENLKKIVGQGQKYLENIVLIYKIMKFEDIHLKENLTKNTVEIAKKFVSLLKVPGDKLVKFIRKSLTESIIPCKPFWNIFATARIILCEYYVQVLNGFWFALGWCLFCFIPTIIVAFKLTKHFLIMTELGRPDEYKKEKPEYELELIDEESSSRSWVTQRNKIRPDNGYRPAQHM